MLLRSRGLTLEIRARCWGVELVDDIVPDSYRAGVVWEGLAVVPRRFVPHYESAHAEAPRMSAKVR